MIKIIHIELLTLVLFLATGCAKKPGDGEMSQGATIALRVDAQSVPSSGDEGRIDNLRLIAFGSAGSDIATRVDANSGMQSLPANSTLTQDMTAGLRDIYVFANETQPLGLTAQLDAVKNNFSELENLKVQYNSDLSAPFFCSYVRSGLDVKTSGNAPLDVEVVRNVSKVVLNLTQEWGAGEPIEKQVIIKRVQVMNLPKYSYLMGRNYIKSDGTSDGFVDSKLFENPTNESVTPGLGLFKHTFTFYVPEFLGALADHGKHAYIEIEGYLDGRPDVICTYRCPLGNDMHTPKNMTDYNITRNRIYKVNGTIISYGALNNIDIKANIEDWNEVNSTPEDVGEYLIVAETTKPLKFTIKEDIAIKASDLNKVKISSKNDKLDWTRSGNTISVGVKDAFATDVPQAAIDELIITLGQFTRRVNIDYRPSVAQRFAKGLLVMNGTGGATIGAPNAPFKDVLIFKWSTFIGMRTCDDAGTPLPTAQVAYNPTIHNVSSPQLITPYIPNTVTEAQYIGRDKDFLNYLHERTDLHNGGLGDPCREIGTVAGKRWRTPTASEWDELLSETPKAANLSPGKAIGFGGYVPRQSGTSSDAGFVNNAHYGWFYGPSAQQQTDAANPTKGSVFIYQKYYGTSDITQNVGITSLPTQNIFSSSASSTAGRFHYYTANDVVGSMGTRTIGDDKTVGNSFAVRCIQQ